MVQRPERKPLTETWPREKRMPMCEAARRTASEIRVSPAAAKSSKREARLTVSPVTVYSAMGVAACPRPQRPLPIHQCYPFPLNSNMRVGQMIRRNPL